RSHRRPRWRLPVTARMRSARSCPSRAKANVRYSSSQAASPGASVTRARWLQSASRAPVEREFQTSFTKGPDWRGGIRGTCGRGFQGTAAARGGAAAGLNSAAEVGPEPLDGSRPCLLRGAQVGALLPVLRSQESVPRARVDLVLELLPEATHRGFRGGDGGVHPLVVAAVEAQNGRLDRSEAGGVRRRAVVHNRRPQLGRVERVLEGRGA